MSACALGDLSSKRDQDVLKRDQDVSFLKEQQESTMADTPSRKRKAPALPPRAGPPSPPADGASSVASRRPAKRQTRTASTGSRTPSRGEDRVGKKPTGSE